MNVQTAPRLSLGIFRTRVLSRLLTVAAVATFVIQAATATTITRPWDLSYTPSYVPTYDPNHDIPTDALDRANYSTTSAWLADCVRLGKAGRINSGTYPVSTSDLGVYAPPGIYGYGSTRPVFVFTDAVGPSTPGYLYVGNFAALKVRNVEFQGFGDVFDLAVGSIDRGLGLYYYQSQSAYAFARFAPAGDSLGGSSSPTGVGVLLNTTLFPRATSGELTLGPSIDISYCRFYHCDRAYCAGSDSVVHGRLDFHKNVLEGTYGGFDLNCT